MINNINKKSIRNITLFILFFIILIFTHLFFDKSISDYNYDAGDYYRLGESLFFDGRLNLSNIATIFRGFYFPFFLGICSVLNNTLHIESSWMYLSSLVLSILLVVFINFSIKLLNVKPKYLLIRTIVFITLLLVFFYGIIIYPLSDMISALLCFSSLYLLLLAYKTNKYILYLLSGITIYITYNIRPIYIVSIIFILLFLLILLSKKYNIKKALMTTTFFILGIIIASLPQIYINYIKTGSLTPFVINNFYYSESVFIKQLFWGLEYSRYETYVGTSHTPDMFFKDNTGSIISNDIEFSSYPLSIIKYIRLFIRYPLEYIAIIGKHIFNAVFNIFPEVYVQNNHISGNRYLLTILSLLIFVIGFIIIYMKSKTVKLPVINILIIVTTMLPSIFILLGAIEARFFVVPYMLLYFLIAFYDYKELKSLTKKEIFKLTIIIVLFIFAALAIESEILANLNDYPLIFKY